MTPHDFVERVLETEALVCPDDAGQLDLTDASLRCTRCQRRFPMARSGVIELLPSAPTTLHDMAPAAYVQFYLEEFVRPFAEDAEAVGWGAPERVPPAIAARRVRQADWVVGMLSEPRQRKPRLLCDVSGGSGYYTFAARSRFEMVLHCDLSVDSLNYTAAKARALGAENMLFLRTDYFRLPFQGSVDRIVCCDTLFGGERHENLLLSSIRKSLRPDGLAVVDFHNWWHNPLRRMGLLPQNFGENRSYSRHETVRLLEGAGIRAFEYFPYHQELDGPGMTAAVLSHVIPPTRLTYRIAGG